MRHNNPMGKHKQQYIAIQNMIRYVELEIKNLQLVKGEENNFLRCLSREILQLNKGRN